MEASFASNPSCDTKGSVSLGILVMSFVPSELINVGQ